MSTLTRTSNAGVGVVIITPDLPSSGPAPAVNYLYAVVDLPTPSNTGDFYSFWSSWNSDTNTLTYFYAYNSKYGGYKGSVSSATLTTYMLPPFLDLPATLPSTITINVTGLIPAAIGSGNLPVSINLSSLVPSAPTNPPVKTGQVNTQLTTSAPALPPGTMEQMQGNLTDDDGTAPEYYAVREYFIQSFTNQTQYFIIFIAALGNEGYSRMLNCIPVSNTSTKTPTPTVFISAFPNSNSPGMNYLTATGYIESTNGQYTSQLLYNGVDNGWQPSAFPTTGSTAGSCYSNPQQL